MSFLEAIRRRPAVAGDAAGDAAGEVAGDAPGAACAAPTGMRASAAAESARAPAVRAARYVPPPSRRRAPASLAERLALPKQNGGGRSRNPNQRVHPRVWLSQGAEAPSKRAPSAPARVAAACVRERQGSACSARFAARNPRFWLRNGKDLTSGLRDDPVLNQPPVDRADTDVTRRARWCKGLVVTIFTTSGSNLRHGVDVFHK